MPRIFALLAMATLLAAGNAAAASAPAPACPSPSFDGFLKAFMGSVEVQKKFSAVPLESQTVDVTAEPEPAVVSKMLSTAELAFPLIPSEQQQAKEGLTMRQSVLDNDTTQVTLSRQDTDYQMSFYFRKTQCWQLFRISDESL